MIDPAECLNLRQHELTRFPLARPGEHLSESRREKLIAKQLHLYQALVPCVGRLKTGVLTTSLHAEDEGLMLSVLLVELPQRSLPVYVMVNRRQVDGDPFTRELEQIRLEQSQASAWIRRASSPATMPTSPQIVDVRRLLRMNSRTGSMYLPSVGDATQISLPRMPDMLPRSVCMSLVVRVYSVSRRDADIKIASVSHAPDESGHSISRSRKYKLVRTQLHQSTASGSKLQIAMDTRADLCVTVLPAIDWVSGQIRHLELVSFIDET